MFRCEAEGYGIHDDRHSMCWEDAVRAYLKWTSRKNEGKIDTDVLFTIKVIEIDDMSLTVRNVSAYAELNIVMEEIDDVTGKQ